MYYRFEEEPDQKHFQEKEHVKERVMESEYTTWSHKHNTHTLVQTQTHIKNMHTNSVKHEMYADADAAAGQTGDVMSV